VRAPLLAQPAQRLQFWLFALTLFFLPFELPIAQGLHGELFQTVGAALPFFFVGPVALYLAIALTTTRTPAAGVLRSEGLRDYALVGFLFVAVGVYACLTTFGDDGNIDGALRELLLGYAVPVAVCGMILLLDQKDRRTIWAVFYAGYAAFLLVSFVFLYLGYRAGLQQGNAVLQLPFGIRVFMWRFTFLEPWNVYATYIGNSNKTSNNLIMFLLLSTRLLDADRIRTNPAVRRIYFSFWALASITLVILFSRAALLLFPFVVIGAGVLRIVPRKVTIALGVALAVSIAIAGAAYSDALAYLFTSKALATDAGFLGTYGSRFDQWSDALRFAWERPRVLAVGLGTSGYSLRFFGDSLAGTHNTFLDAFFESGVGGVLLLALVLVTTAALCLDRKRARPRDPLALGATLVLVLLMTREHSFAYLFATSLGGFCLAAIFFILAERRLGFDDPSCDEARVAVDRPIFTIPALSEDR